MQEFIAISMLVIALVLFVMFDRLGSTAQALGSAERISLTYERESLWTGVNIMLYTTLDGIMMVELLGNYACYDNEIISFNPSRNINISEIIVKVLNSYYGEHNWAFELRSDAPVMLRKCRRGDEIAETECVFSPDIEFEAYDFIYPMPCNQGFGEGTVYVY